MSILVHRHGILGGESTAVASNITITETVVDFGSAAAALYDITSLGTDVFKIQVSSHNITLAGSTTINARVSTDGGSTFDSGAATYNRALLNEAQDIGDSLTFATNNRQNATDSQFLTEIFGTAISSSTIFDGQSHLSGANAASCSVCFRTTEQVEDALRFFSASAVNMTDGMFVIEVWTLN